MSEEKDLPHLGIHSNQRHKLASHSQSVPNIMVLLLIASTYTHTHTLTHTHAHRTQLILFFHQAMFRLRASSFTPYTLALCAPYSANPLPFAIIFPATYFYFFIIEGRGCSLLKIGPAVGGTNRAENRVKRSSVIITFI